MSTETTAQTIARWNRERAALVAEAAAEGIDLTPYARAEHPERLAKTLDTLRESRDYQPQVGDGMTLAYPQDMYPYVIVRVSPSGKTVWVKPLETVSTATGHEPARFDGPFPVWEHTYTDEERKSLLIEDAPETRVNRSRDGLSWTANGTPYLYGGAGYRRNFSY